MNPSLVFLREREGVHLDVTYQRQALGSRLAFSHSLTVIKDGGLEGEGDGGGTHSLTFFYLPRSTAKGQTHSSELLSRSCVERFTAESLELKQWVFNAAWTKPATVFQWPVFLSQVAASL
ncbi:hypothetical protein EYF80_018732 [Liparis tanakae]|uniref:Uncharacterized protein n=1 Tax=Liparis tanakae TaxID=230148 RepID=A0A4Z2HZT1_9TELE|nr:hypothetical protein EYF80_018732 [Liparis tanakae]